MSINPTPTLTITGVPAIEVCTVPDWRGRPALSATAPTVLGDLSVRWGRSDSWETPEPAVLSVELFDPTGAVLDLVRDSSLFGRALAVTIPTNTTPRRLFYGTVSDAEVTETTVDTATGQRTGWRLLLTAADWRARARNYVLPPSQWPRETYSSRVSSFTFWMPYGLLVASAWHPNAGYASSNLYATEATGNADELVALLAATTGDFHQYNPDTHRLEIIPTVTPPTPAATLRHAAGAVTITANDTARTNPARTWTGTTLSGCELSTAGQGHLTFSPADRIGEVHVRYGPNLELTTTRTDTTAPSPRSSATYDTWFEASSSPNQVAIEVLRRAMGEARGPHHPPVEYRTDTTGGFDSWTQALAVLKTWETAQPIAVTGSPWTRAAAAALVHTVLGGTLTYRRGHWHARMTLRRTGAPRGAGVPWTDAATAGLKWGHTATPHLDPSVVWADLAAGVTTGTVLPEQE